MMNKQITDQRNTNLFSFRMSCLEAQERRRFEERYTLKNLNFNAESLQTTGNTDDNGRRDGPVVRQRTSNPEVPGSSPAQLTTWICFTVAPFSLPRPCFVYSQLVCFPPVGIHQFSLYIYLFHSCFLSVPTVALQC